MIFICPWCLLVNIILAVLVVPVLAFLGKVCKIQWANRAYNWCIAKMKSLKIWKNKETPSCASEGCNCDKEEDNGKGC